MASAVNPHGRRIVIVGASVAGLACAEHLRLSDYPGPITVLDRQPQQPCDRPPLSKGYLIGADVDIALPYAALAGDDEVDIQLGQQVSDLRLDERRVECTSGEGFDYDALVIATGSTPRRLNISGRELAGIHVLREEPDALALREALVGVRNCVIVGAGFIGLEVASALRTLGIAVQLVTDLATPLSPAFGAELAAHEIMLLEAAGVDFLPQTSVVAYRGEGGRVCGVELGNGQVLGCDLVLEAVGVAPCIDWLCKSGLSLGDGIECDSSCRAAEDVYAIGDVCRWFNPRYGVRMRIEHWTNAIEQAALVATNLADGTELPYAGVPYFWSDHFGVQLQFAGTLVGASESNVVLSSKPGALTVHYADEFGALRGVLSIGDPRPIIDYRRSAATRGTDAAPDHRE